MKAIVSMNTTTIFNNMTYKHEEMIFSSMKAAKAYLAGVTPQNAIVTYSTDDTRIWKLPNNNVLRYTAIVKRLVK